MFGRAGPLARRRLAARTGATGACALKADPPVASASLEIAKPPPASVPAAISPFLRKARLSILLSSSGLILCVRVPILGLSVLWAAGLFAASVRAAVPAPACAPSTLNNSALLDGSVTVSPLPGSRDATPQTQISFLGIPAGELSEVSVIGSRTGAHPGRLLAYSQGDGASFVPARPFVEGETVTAHAQVRTGGAVRQLSDQFAIGHQDAISSTPETIHSGSPAEIQSFRSRPDLRPPTLTVTAQSAAVAPGDMFAAPYNGPGQSGPMILEPGGGLIWFKPLPRGTSATNLQVQEYAGSQVLTWWQGDVSVHGFGLGEDVIADSGYTDIAHVRAGDGLRADLHEFQLTPAGTALITAYEPIYCNLTSAGGPSYGAVTDSVLQEIDVKTGLVMFQWTSLDHVPLNESYESARNSTTSWPFDFFHINSIDLAPDGSLLVSARNTWTVYDINSSSGQIAWRLGGKHSSFAMGPGASTAWQHDARELANGTISIFDNGSSPKVHQQSRGIVVSLSAQRRTATLASQLLRPSPLLSESQGNMQALPNGDWFIGWGQIPDFSELSATGQLLFDAHFPPGDQSYRDFRFAWTGTPVHAPAFAVAPGAGGGTVYASWNGATLVDGWRVLAGASSADLTPVAQAPRGGFETAIPLPPTTVGPYMTVQALDAVGAVIGTARTTTITATTAHQAGIMAGGPRR
jgi:Arylsulfotransferase (ASST)